jgi:endonuclease/exonuclease/phosphatase (EEP) superfamily protein YafD
VRIVALAIALLGCVMVLPVMAARALGGDPPQPGPQLAALAPVATPIAGMALAGSLLARMRWWSVVPASLFATLLAWQVVPSAEGWWQARSVPVASSAADGVQSGGEVRVLTVNASLGQVDAAAVIAEVRRLRIDVLTVEELTPALVGRLTSAGLGQDLPSQVLRAEAGFTGTGIWSRWPMTPLGDVAGTQSAMPQATVRPPDGPTFTVIAVHPTAPAGQGAEQQWRSDLQRVRSAIDEAVAARRTGGPVIVVGDFNATRDHALFRNLLAPGLRDALDTASDAPWLGYTFPTDRDYPPIMRLDHILYADQALECTSATTVAVPGTDHRAVIATLRFR